MPQLIGEEEDVSVYDIADHPDFRFRTTDIVIRIGNAEDGAPHKEDEVRPWFRPTAAAPPLQQLQCRGVPPGGSRSQPASPVGSWLPQAPSPAEQLPTAELPLSLTTCPGLAARPPAGPHHVHAAVLVIREAGFLSSGP